MKENKLKSIVFDIYRDLYLNATPSANFDEIYENAEIIDGIRNIPYDNYEIDDRLMLEIIKMHTQINALDKRESDSVKLEVLLGCSPKSKIVESNRY